MTQSNLTLRGGAERVVLKIAQHYDAKIYTAEYDRDNTYEGFKDLDVSVMKKGFVPSIMPYGRVSQGLHYGLSFYNLKIKEDYDVINAHIAPSHWVRNRNERVLWYVHTPLRDLYDLYKYRLSLKKSYQKPVHIVGTSAARLLDQSVARKIEVMVANSRNTQSRIMKYYHRTADVMGGGIDYEDYRNDGDGRYFLYPSRISPNKRQEYAINAFEIFKRKTKGYTLILTGAVSKDRAYQNYYLKIKELAKRVGGIKIITNAGDTELRKLYAKSTAVLYTPVNEDYGLVPLEGMASSKPVISVNEGGPTETIENSKTGFLVNSENDMATAMRLIAEEPSIAEEIGKRARREVVARHSWKIFFRSFDKELKRVGSS
jgi:glycosyltransferase involved in cell wall biosynthesis